jgi:hypothetical protein
MAQILACSGALEELDFKEEIEKEVLGSATVDIDLQFQLS